MASVIRVNTINSRSGLSTVTFDNSGAGVEVAGVVTATSFSGSGGILKVSGAGSRSILVGSTDASGVSIGLDGDSNGDGSGSDYALLQHTNAGELKILNDNPSGSGPIIFGTPLEKLRIDSTGDVRFAGTNLTDNTNKNVNLTAPSYDIDEEDVNIVQVENESGFNQISIGGGTSGLNAATNLRFLTASAVNTTTGTERLRIKSDGDVEIGGNLKTNNLPGRNLIINGAFKINQRGSTSTADGIHTVDRFSMEYGGENEVPTQTQHALTSSDTGPWEKGLRYSYHIQNGNQTGGAGTTDYMRIATRLEAQDLANSGWHYTSTSSYATLSFWVKSSVAQTFYGQVFSQDGTPQNFPFSTGTLSANTWTKVEINIPGGSNVQFDNNNKQGMVIYWWPFGGTNYTGSPTLNTWAGFSSGNRIPDMTSTWWTTNDATFELTGIQLEAGSQATEFDHLPYVEDLRRCYRYFYKITGDSGDRPGIGGCCVNTTEARMNVNFPVTMRGIPAIDGSGTAQFDAENDSADFNCADMTVESAPTGLINSLGLQIVTSSMTGGQGGNLRFRSDSSYLTFNAEL